MSRRIFIVNASPLILLHRVKRLELLAMLARAVKVPEAVLGELREGAEYDDTAEHVTSCAGIEVVANLAVPSEIEAWDLGIGESQVLARASRENARAILDDRAARRCGRSLGVAVMSTLGVVVSAKKAGHIEMARSVIEDLRAEGMYVSDTIMDAALRSAGEPAGE